MKARVAGGPSRTVGGGDGWERGAEPCGKLGEGKKEEEEFSFLTFYTFIIEAFARGGFGPRLGGSVVIGQ